AEIRAIVPDRLEERARLPPDTAEIVDPVEEGHARDDAAIPAERVGVGGALEDEPRDRRRRSGREDRAREERPRERARLQEKPPRPRVGRRRVLAQHPHPVAPLFGRTREPGIDRRVIRRMDRGRGAAEDELRAFTPEAPPELDVLDKDRRVEPACTEEELTR